VQPQIASVESTSTQIDLRLSWCCGADSLGCDAHGGCRPAQTGPSRARTSSSIAQVTSTVVPGRVNGCLFLSPSTLTSLNTVDLAD